jgi:hypothetical protein
MSLMATLRFFRPTVCTSVIVMAIEILDEPVLELFFRCTAPCRDRDDASGDLTEIGRKTVDWI